MIDQNPYGSSNIISKIPSFRRKPESEKTGCRIKSGMTSFDMFTCRRNIYIIDIELTL